MAIKLAPDAFDFPETSDPANPPAGYMRVYANAGAMMQRDSAGTETPLGGGGSFSDFTVTGDSGTPQTIEDGNTLTIEGGAGIDTVAGATDKVTVAVDSTVIRTTGTQSIGVGLTIDRPFIYSYENAIHGHIDAASGGTLTAAAIASGTLAHERGGLEADVSAYSGLLKISGGATSQAVANTDYAAAGAYGIPFIDPTLQTWTNLNHGAGTYTEDTTNNSLTIENEDGNATIQVRGWYFTAPAAPYTATFFVEQQNNIATNNGACVFHRQNSTGELRTVCWRSDATNLSFIVTNWNSATSLNANTVTNVRFTNEPRWFQIEDDNTDTYYRISPDGIVWLTLYTIARTTFLTPDELGFGVLVQTASTYNVAASLLSLELT